jgi:carboxylesterase type B
MEVAFGWSAASTASKVPSELACPSEPPLFNRIHLLSKQAWCYKHRSSQALEKRGNWRLGLSNSTSSELTGDAGVEMSRLDRLTSYVRMYVHTVHMYIASSNEGQDI